MNDDSFSSIDKLVEFGMGIAVARQMVETMNHTMSRMQIPGAQMTAPDSVSSGYFALVNDAQVGPLNSEEISKLAANRKIKEDTLVWKSGMSGWKMAKDIPEVYKHILLNE